MVYLDLLFAQNVLMDYLLLSLTSTWRTVPVRKWRLWLAAVVGGTYALCFFSLKLGFLYTFVAKIVFSCVIVFLAFGFSGWVPFFRLLATFYMTAFLMGGCVVALFWLLQSQVDTLYRFRFLRSVDMVQSSFMGVLSIGYIFSWCFSRGAYRSLQRHKLVMDQLVQVTGVVLGQRFQCTGLVDTGNQLYDPVSRTPVMLIEVTVMPFVPEPLVRMVDKAMTTGHVDAGLERLDDSWLSRIRIVPYRTVARTDAWLVALRPDRLTLQAGERRYEMHRVLIGLTTAPLSADGTYQAIVHSSLLQYQAS